jgi:hypothetical protein
MRISALIVFAASISPIAAFAQYGSVYQQPRVYQAPSFQPAPMYGSGSNPNSVQSSGYERSNGTYVQPYQRTAPNATINDNYSTRGNVNPSNGKVGTRNGSIYGQ